MAIRKEEKSLEQAQKEAEMIGEFAKDGRNRKEAKTIANKLEAVIDHQNEAKEADSNKITLSTAAEQEQLIQNVLDESKYNIRNATREAARDISQYTQTW